MIRWAFTSPDSPACFSSAQNVLHEVRKKFPKVKLGQVEDILQRITTYTRHRKHRVSYPRRATIGYGYMVDVQVRFT